MFDLEPIENSIGSRIASDPEVYPNTPPKTFSSFKPSMQDFWSHPWGVDLSLFRGLPTGRPGPGQGVQGTPCTTTKTVGFSGFLPPRLIDATAQASVDSRSSNSRASVASLARQRAGRGAGVPGTWRGPTAMTGRPLVEGARAPGRLDLTIPFPHQAVDSSISSIAPSCK